MLRFACAALLLVPSLAWAPHRPLRAVSQRGAADYGSSDDLFGGGGQHNPPTEKQVAFAKRLAAETQTGIPLDAMESSASMSAFIESALQQRPSAAEPNGGGGGYGGGAYGGGVGGELRAPSAKQLEFARRLAEERGIEIPGPALESGIAISRFIDGILRERWGAGIRLLH